MIFEIDDTRCSNLLEKYPVLSNYGYHNEREGIFAGTSGDIVINSLDDLVRLCSDLHEEVIISVREHRKKPALEIYNDYRE